MSYVVGVDIPAERTAQILKDLQFKVQDAGEELLVTVPAHRVDVSLEADLIEEVARMYGYDRVPATLPYGQSTQESGPESNCLLRGSGTTWPAPACTRWLPTALSTPGCLTA